MRKEYELVGENILSAEKEGEEYIVNLNDMPILSGSEIEVEAMSEQVDLILNVLYVQGRLKNKEEL